MYNVMKHLPTPVANVVGRNALRVQKHSPAILFGVGVVGFGATIVTASRATVKAKAIIDEHVTSMGEIDQATALGADENAKGSYSDDDRRNDHFYIWARTCVGLTRLYLPSIALATLSIGSFAGAQYILNARNASLAAAAKLAEAAYDKYRDRVIEEFGAEKDEELRLGLKANKVSVTDEEGKEKKETMMTVSEDSPSMYARFFDEFNKNFNKNDRQLNRLFLSTQQNYLNDVLKVRGHVFLNEVYDALGMERTSAGAVVGWAITKDGTDNFIDFGVFNSNDLQKRMFVNGDERAVLLDFNVNGVIYDLI